MTSQYTLIGSGRVADVVSHGSNVIKLYRHDNGKRQAFHEASVISMLEGGELRTPSVYSVQRIGDRWGLEMSRAPDTAISLNGERLAAWFARLHWRVHQIRGKSLNSLKQRLSRNIEAAPHLVQDDRTRLLLLLHSLPDDDCLCHGDFHPGNIMGSNDEPYVIDWLDATTGPAQADACRTYLLALHNASELAGPYLAEYCGVSGYSSEEIVKWLPIVSAARLAEGVDEETSRLLALAKSDT